MDLTAVLLALVLLLLGLVVGLAVGAAWGGGRAGSRPGPPALEPSGADHAEVAQVVVGLDRLHDQMRDLEHQRVSWQTQLHEQVSEVRRSTDTLRRETRALSTALRRPQVRGRWGELHLRRAVELAGMVEHCDFAEQGTVAAHDPAPGREHDAVLRPDLVVSLAGGRHVVVDAKVPLEAYLDACEVAELDEPDHDLHRHHLARHARQLRHHVDQLSSKTYWRALPGTPAFVVMFVPAESVLAAALEVDRDLLEHASARQVVLASPTTLIALLRTVAHGWSHERLAEQAADILRLGRELHGRLRTMTTHLDQVGRALDSTVTRYNQAVGSLESRVLVTARRFEDLAPGEALSPPRTVGLRAVRRADPDHATRPTSVEAVE